MIALDVARIEAGLILIEVDYTSSKKALIAAPEKFHGGDRFGEETRGFEKDNFAGARRWLESKEKGAERALVSGWRLTGHEVLRVRSACTKRWRWPAAGAPSMA